MRLGFRFGLVFFGFGLASLVACGGSDDSQGTATTSAEAILAGTRLSESEVAQLLSQAGFADSDIPTMVCTAKYESSFWDGARHRNSNGSTDWGLFQINDRAGWLRACNVTTSGLLDGATNAQCAKVVFDQQGIMAWYGYQHHQSECDSYQVSGWSGSAPPPGPVGGSGSNGGACTGGTVACGDGTCGLNDGRACNDPSDCCSNACSFGRCGSSYGGSGGGSCAAAGQLCNDGPDCCGYADGTSTCQEDAYNPNVARCVRTRH